MMMRMLKHKLEELLAEGKKFLESGEDSKFAYRVTMANLLLEDSGMTTARLSELSGVSTRTLNDRVKKADESGFETLRGGKAPGPITALKLRLYFYTVNNLRILPLSGRLDVEAEHARSLLSC